MKQWFKNTGIYMLIILIIAVCCMLPELLDGIYASGHDQYFHRGIISGYKELFANDLFFSTGGNILPFIGINLGYGTPMFYGILPHLLSGFICYVFNINPPAVMFLFYFLNFFLSGITMFCFAKQLFKNNNYAIIVAAIYMVIPYHFTQIYIRDSYSESWLLVTFPIILLSLYYCIKQESKWIWFFISGLSLSIYCHPMTTFLNCLFLIPPIVFYYKQIFTKKNVILFIIASIILILLISPTLYNLGYLKSLDLYRVFADNVMANTNYFLARVLPIDKFFPWNVTLDDMGFYFTLPIIILFLISVFFYKKFSKKDKKLINCILVVFIITILYLTNIIPLQKLPDVFINSQFPWRIYTITAISISLLAPLFIIFIKKYTKLIVTVILFILILSINTINIYQYDINNNLVVSSKENNFLALQLESFGVQHEYLTNKTLINNDYLINRAQQGIISLDNNCKINVIDNNVPNATFSVSNIKNSSCLVEFPRVYYPGYYLTINDQEIPVSISKQGFLQAQINENGEYHLVYKGTKGQRIVRYVPLVTLIVVLIGYFYWRISRKNQLIK